MTQPVTTDAAEAKTVTLALTWEDRGEGDADLRLGPIHVGSVYEGRPGNWRAASRSTIVDHMSNHQSRQAAIDAMEAAVIQIGDLP